MSAKRALLATACLLALCAPAALAREKLAPPAPEFPTGDAWLNAKPLTMARLRERRAVLVAFLNTANVNSLRAAQTLEAWFDLYGLKGLMVIGVLSPEYGFQKDPRLARAAVKRLGVTFPVLLDGDRQVWKAYANEGWPAFYLVDHKGRIVFDHLGETGPTEIESQIRAAIAEVPGAESASFAPQSSDPPTQDCGAMTPELSLGSARGKTLRVKPDEPARRLLLESRDGETAARGPWESLPDALRLAEDDPEDPEEAAFLRLIGRGLQVFGTLGSAGAPPASFFLRQDGLWLHPGNAGKDVEFDDDGRSFVKAAEPRLYELVRNPNDAIHELVLTPSRKGAAVYGFSFADRCLPVKPP